MLYTWKRSYRVPPHWLGPLINDEDSEYQAEVEKFRDMVRNEIYAFTNFEVDIDFSLKDDDPSLPRDEEVGYCIYFYNKREKYEYKGRIEYVSVIYRRRGVEFPTTYTLQVHGGAVIGKFGLTKRLLVDLAKAARHLKARIIALDKWGTVLTYADPGDSIERIRMRYGTNHKMAFLAPERVEEYFNYAKETNPAVSAYGIGPYLATCGTCFWLEKNSNGPPHRCLRWTDAIHHEDWPSCREYTKTSP